MNSPLRSAAPALPPRTTLQSRRSPLASPEQQNALLRDLPLRDRTNAMTSFAACTSRGGEPLRTLAPRVLQLNLGKLCNMTCAHCHVDAGPDRRDAMMSEEVVASCIRLIDTLPIETLDLTGGAPELHQAFRRLVSAARARGIHVIDRCNLTVLLLPRFRALPAWLAAQGVEVVASLPHYRASHTDAQRGEGTYARSMEAMRALNAVGYGQGDPERRLTLMANPAGTYLFTHQGAMEQTWRERLAADHGVYFDRLIALTNMPISRFLAWLVERGELVAYVQRLADAHRDQNLAGLMCRDTLSVDWQGRVFDCDFNQQLDLVSEDARGALDVHRLLDATLVGRDIRVGNHCFGCTAGAGSSCGGTVT